MIRTRMLQQAYTTCVLSIDYITLRTINFSYKLLDTTKSQSDMSRSLIVRKVADVVSIRMHNTIIVYILVNDV